VLVYSQASVAVFQQFEFLAVVEQSFVSTQLRRERDWFSALQLQKGDEEEKAAAGGLHPFG
jgi:hypothetical protein